MDFLFLLFITALLQPAELVNPCKAKSFPAGTVCVCTEAYCDSIEAVGNIPAGTAKVYSSNNIGARLRPSTLIWNATESTDPDTLSITVNAGKQYQEIIGFGGAFTDAAGINIASLPNALQDTLLAQYFATDGLHYSIGRIPMASCDFSTHEYSYDDEDGDFDLKSFKLAPEDYKYKIPYIRKAQLLSDGKVKLFGSPWSAPGWLKNSGRMSGNGTLKGKPGDKYYDTWAKYFIKFLQSYEAENVSFWGLTAQNEPTTGFIYNYAFQTMGFSPEMQRDFIKLNLGPALANSKFSHVKLMILDDNRLMLPKWAQVVLSDPDAARYVSGIALHWYYDRLVPPKVLDVTRKAFPSTFLLATEACLGALPPPLEFHRGPLLGDWTSAERYALDIIQDLNHWVAGWTDWNLALNMEGGPNWVKNFVDSPIIVNAAAKEFYKQPMFYAIGHISAFIEVGSRRIDWKKTSGSDSNLAILAVRNPSGRKVVVVVNSDLYGKKIAIRDAEVIGKSVTLLMKPYSMATVLWD